MRAILVSLLLAAPVLQDVDAKKARVGEILKAMVQAQKEAGGDKAKEVEALRKLAPLVEELRGLIQDIAGPNLEKQSALFQELMEKFLPEEAAAQRTAANERLASTALMSIGTAQAEFFAFDPDGDGVANFWVGDISGLRRIRLKTGRAVELIDDQIARADARPALALDAEGKLPKVETIYFLRAGAAAPRFGYRFITLASYEESDGKTTAYDNGGGRNATKFGICAYPSEHGKTGKMTFLKNEDLKTHLWKKDTGGKPPDVFPADPQKAGWQPVE